MFHAVRSLPSLVHALARRLPSGLWVTVVLLLATACGGDDPPSSVTASVQMHMEPSRLVFHPRTGPIAVDIVNDGKDPLFLNDARIEGPDWSSFSITDARTSGIIPPGERATIHIEAEAASLLGPGDSRPIVAEGAEPPEPIAADEYRTGEAALRFVANGEEVRAPIAFEDPHWLGQFVLPTLVKILALVMGFIMPLASLLTWLERKQSAMMQDRLGPNMAALGYGRIQLRLWGIPHFIADGIKMLFKEDFIPKHAHRALYSLAPLFAFAPAMVVFAIMPFGDAVCYDRLGEVLSQADVNQCADGRGGTALQIAHIDVGLLYYFAIASLATYGTALAGWSSYNKWAILGSLRASAQMISYEVAIGLTLVGALLVYGTLEPHAIVRAQMDSYWGVILQPVALILFLTAGIAETKRAPFDLPEADSEIIGYFIEYSGMRFGLFFLAEFIEVIFMSAMVATLFLGGWSVPFMDAHGFSAPWAAQLFLGGAGTILCGIGIGAWRASKHGELFGVLLVLIGSLHLFGASWSLFTGWGTAIPHILIIVIGLLTWGIKVFVLCWVQLLIRWTLPRFRYDQLMSLGWKGLLPLSIANIVITAAIVYFLLPSGQPPA
jgi:NADH-quinone oxidoreductase subunit H